MGQCFSGPEQKYATDELAALKKQLEEKNAEIASLKNKASTGTAAAAGAVADTASGEVAALKQQVESLRKQLTSAQASATAGAAAPAKASGGVVDALFFPDAKLPCHASKRPGGCKRPNCNFSHEPTSLSKFLDYMQQAHKTLEICLFTITCDDIADVVIELHKKGVKVRVITDNDQTESTGSDIGKFREAGIEVRQDSAPTHMHHKFCIIDNNLLMSGSFNWTRQAVLGNQENVVVLDNPKLVKVFADQFEKLWKQFAPS